MNEHPFTIGETVEWLMRPTGGSSNGYLHGIVVKLGASKVAIAVQSPKTFEWRGKWVSPLSLRKIPSGGINGAVCWECGRLYSLAELEEIDETEIVPCGHAWTGLFDTVDE